MRDPKIARRAAISVNGFAEITVLIGTESLTKSPLNFFIHLNTEGLELITM